MQPRIALHEAGRSLAVRRYEEATWAPARASMPQVCPKGENRILTTKRSRAYRGVDLQK
jgi:hypothetical protein